MKLSRNWLSRYVNLDGIADETIFQRLTMTTAEFEEFIRIGHHFQQVKIGKVLSVQQHPNADKLSLTEVQVGSDTFHIVCGAPNVAAGQTVPVALEGTELPTNEPDKKFIIKKSKIRGADSEGMICSKAELGLEEKSDGIWPLDIDLQKIPTGTPLSEALRLTADTIFDIDNKSITHRPDLWNHVGFSRELSAIFQRSFTPPKPAPISKESEPAVKVMIENGEDCPRYCGLIVDNITIKPSPNWLRQSLEAVGSRSINNIVDITNFVMLEIGEPLHAFDLKKLTGDTIFIRRAKSGENITTLDSQERKLTTEDLVIADASGPIALAGIMGGEKSEVSDETTSIFLEAANFYPGRLRRTAARINLRTDAVLRFEKSLDPNIADYAIFRAYELIKQIESEATCRNFVDNYPKPIHEIELTIAHTLIENRLGISLTPEKIEQILNSLELKTQLKSTPNETEYKIIIPTWRATKDLSIAEDIVEEIGRVIGYDSIPPVPPAFSVNPTAHNAKRQFEHQLRQLMTGTGQADEVFLYSFYGQKLLSQIELDGASELRLRNFLSDEMDRLRITLAPGLVKAASENLRFFDRFRMFEIGRTYHKHERKKENEAAPLSREESHLGFIACEDKSVQNPFYIGRDILSQILHKLNLTEFILKRLDPTKEKNLSFLHPGRSAFIEIFNKKIGYIGELHPRVMKNFDMDRRAVLFDLNIDILMELSANRKKKFNSPPKFPAAYFELTVLAPIKTECSAITEILRKGKILSLTEIQSLTVFTGGNLATEQKAVSLGLTFQREDGTIAPDELKKSQDLAIGLLAKSGYPLR